jgi:conjugal transfer pilus assembly protein TrbC
VWGTECPPRASGRWQRVAHVATAIVWLGWATVAGAQAPDVTEADIERVRRTQAIVTERDIENARRQHGRTGAALAAPQPGPAAPNLDALPQLLTARPIDLEAIARGYVSQTQAMDAAAGLQQGPGLIVFVSLSVPRPTLDRLLDQAALAGATVVLRGFVQGSLRATVAEVQALIGQRQISLQIDPPAFDRFAVTRVPSVVLVRDGARPVSCASGTCAPPEAFLKADGDVSLDYALEHMQRVAPAFHDDAALFLARLRP